MAKKIIDPFSALFFALMWDWNGTLIRDARFFYTKVLIPILEGFGADMSDYKTRSGYEDLRSEFSQLGPPAFIRMIARERKLRVKIEKKSKGVIVVKEVPLTWDRDMQPLVKKRYADGNFGLMPHAKAMLQVYFDMHIPMGLVSGMPHDELVKAVEQKGLMDLFVSIEGGQSDKKDAYTDFLETVNCSEMPERVVSLTDSAKDIIESKDVGMVPVGIDKGYGSPESLHDANPLLVISDLLKLRKLTGIRRMQRVGKEIRAI